MAGSTAHLDIEQGFSQRARHGSIADDVPALTPERNHAITTFLHLQRPGCDCDSRCRPGRPAQSVVSLGERHVFTRAGALVVGIINLIYGRNAGRADRVGFSLCGGIYLAICSLPGLRDSVCPRLATEVVFDLLYPYLSPAANPSGSTIIVTTDHPVGRARTLAQRT